MKEITPSELKHWMDEKKEFQLVDVRELHETEISSIGGDCIPMARIIEEKHRIRTDVPVVMYCRSGSRSATVILHLEKNGFDNLYNLTGGILAYADQIDPNLPKY